MLEGALVSASDFAPVMTFVQANAAVIVPAGVGIVVVLAGIKLLPGMIKGWIRA